MASLEDMMPWSLIYGHQTLTHQREIAGYKLKLEFIAKNVCEELMLQHPDVFRQWMMNCACS